MDVKTRSKQIGSRLKEVQQSLGYSTDDMAEVLGVSIEQYRKYCKGETILPLDRILDLYDNKHFDIEYLLLGKQIDNTEFSVVISSMTEKERARFLSDAMDYVKGKLI
ncbi:Transcriptional regulator, contains XRE-family HTH domain [Pseudobutyrivibrio sp. YE44]|uniref:helix-turn-helix domain-containing protein n=1 Tax=Pseudobutyrivibrio sp. YE44 TaxID=1520802 RepID=UPI000882EB83|nr:helix-turn-helix transcriptional regulator [Pseudobutyrivibrio sp. YE44]SDB07219.1 Transcriptional regulator, contains XRE-family HTH domain [Pseudobutyrivibrio sp. YE44]